jgi:hypothetical protein
MCTVELSALQRSPIKHVYVSLAMLKVSNQQVTRKLIMGIMIRSVHVLCNNMSVLIELLFSCLYSFKATLLWHRKEMFIYEVLITQMIQKNQLACPPSLGSVCGCLPFTRNIASRILTSMCFVPIFSAPNLKGRPRKKKLSVSQRRDSQGHSQGPQGPQEPSTLENKSPTKVYHSPNIWFNCSHA